MSEQDDLARAAQSAVSDALHAIEWLTQALADSHDVNGIAALRMRLGHARQKFLNAVAAIDHRPAASWPLPRRVTGDGAS